MVVFVNNQKRELTNQHSITNLLNQIQLENTRGLALAVNNTVIPKKSWADYNLKENDKITIIRATQGG